MSHLSQWYRRSSLLLLLIATLALGTASLPAPAFAVTASPIAQRYNTDKAVAELLGAPTGKEFTVAGGSQRDYTWGSLYYSKATGVHEVHGAIWWAYRGKNGPSGIGFPITDEDLVYFKYAPNVAGASSRFTQGELVWNPKTSNVTYMSKAVSDKWNRSPYPFLGMPIADERPASTGTVASFESGAIYANSTGAHVLSNGYPSGSNGIFAKYTKLFADKGFLGVPVADEEYIAATPSYSEGRYQEFTNGVMFQQGMRGTNGTRAQAYEIHGAILDKFWELGGLNRFGYPTTDEVATPAAFGIPGRISNFQFARILYNSSTHEVTVRR